MTVLFDTCDMLSLINCIEVFKHQDINLNINIQTPEYNITKKEIQTSEFLL